jgi:dienelactone hydrolase
MSSPFDFLEELKRRRVFRVAAAYAVAAWVLLQIAEVTFEPLGLPESSLRTLILVLALGFPLAVVVGFAFDLGTRRDARTADVAAAAVHTGPARWAGRTAVTLLIIVAAYAGYRGFAFWEQVRWAQDIAQPELVRRIERNDFAGAFALARELEVRLGSQPALESVWQLISAPVAFETDPPDATVSYRPYGDPEAPWTVLGQSPVAEVRVPRGPSLWRIEKPEYVTRTFARPPTAAPAPQFRWPSEYVLDRVEDQEEDVVAVPGRTYFQVSLGGFPVGQSYELDRFFIDRTEVRNAEYQEFVAAGGYQREEFWQEPFVDLEGTTLTFTQAMERFDDSTARPGPAGWIAGRHPDGEGNHPVGGVSWYEAMAYARFRGRDLPTAYHWSAAALPDVEIVEPLAPALAAQSNLGSRGTLPVGSTTGLSAVGALDMFGNVSEWVRTARGSDARFTLGLGWDDPAYNASLASSASPWSRRPSQGFRLATYPKGDPDPSLLAAVDISFPDYEAMESLSDDALELLDQMAGYAKGPVLAEEAPIELPDGTRGIRAEVDAPYSEEDLPIFILLPEGFEPPYQTIIWFGGLNAINVRDNSSLIGFDLKVADFLRQSGRMLVMPIWSGTHERNDGSTFARFMGDANSQSEVVRSWGRDLNLVVDYLETREDVDAERIAYVGLSLGAAIGGVVVSREPRLRTVAFWSGGFAASSPPETATLRASLARRIEVPMLMVNGRHDFVFPLELQQSFFRMVSTPPEDKRHVLFDAGHFGWPIGDFVRENLDWFDRYLGRPSRS